MGTQGDLVGANIKALQNRVCLEYASPVGRFRQHDIERRQQSLKTVDATSRYTLIAPLSLPGFIGCDNALAVFNVIEQKPVKKIQGISQSYSVLVSIQCEFINIKKKVTKYLFQVVADHDVCNEGYFHQIQVNADGSLLLLVSNRATYAARVPTEMDETSIIAEESSHAFFYANIVRAEVLIDKRNATQASRTVVKVAFHVNYNDTICMMTMEPKCDGACNVENPSNGKCHEPVEKKRESGGDKLKDGPQVEMEGVIRIFNVEQSIDRPYMEIRLAEPFCRTGDENAEHAPDACPQGALVDFHWDASDSNTWGASTLFVMSNYGFVFAYCPIILPNCFSTFKIKRSIVIEAAALLKEGYTIKSDKKIKSVSSTEDIEQIMGCLGNVSREEVNYHGKNIGMVTVIPYIFKLEVDDKSSNQQFQALAVARTYPEIVIVTAGSNGSVMLFTKDTTLKPRTTHFKQADEKRDIIYIRCSDANRTRRAQCGTHNSLIAISDDTCIMHSAYETNAVITRNRSIDLKNIVHAKIAEDHIYYQSYPIIVAGSGDKHTHSEFKGYWSDVERNIYIVQATCCYVKSQKELKQIALTFTPMAGRGERNEPSKIEAKVVKSQGVDSRTGSAIEKTVTTTSHRNETIRRATEKLKKYASDMERDAASSFKTARELVKKDMNYREKTVEIVKIISSIDANVLFYLKTRKAFELEVTQCLEVYKGIGESARKVFNTLTEYGTKLQKMKSRVAALKKQNEDVMLRKQRILAMKDEMLQLKINDSAAIRISDLITSVYLRLSQKINKVLTCRVGSNADRMSNFKECVKTVVDQWLGDTLKANSEQMERTFRRMQNIRNRILELE